MPDTSLVLRTLGAGGPVGTKLASVICSLIRKVGDREVDGLDHYQYVDGDGHLVRGRCFPARWWPRLTKALETGAFDRMSAGAIVEVMIAHDQP